MTCVLGMVVSREREIRNFVKTPFYKIVGNFGEENANFNAEWKVNEKSKKAAVSYGCFFPLFTAVQLDEKGKSEFVKKVYAFPLCKRAKIR